MVSKRGPKRAVKKFKAIASKQAKRGILIRRGSLRNALVSNLKKGTGRTDIKIGAASKVATKSEGSIPIEQRAGFPLTLKKGGVHPKDWKSFQGVPIHVDFARVPWLPDDWGQGVKQTQANGRSTGTGGGILTTFVAPDGKSFFHKHTSEAYFGKGPLTHKDGWNGQVRLAKIQAKQALELARAEGSNGGLDKDESLFRLLSRAERKHLPSMDVLHVCVISARRATQIEGVKDIFMVQSQFEEAGITPTWYVDEGSLQDYKALGLNAVIGGKLTPARNKGLADARRLGKVCVQASDDITAWEYRDGPSAKVRTDDAVNAAWSAAKRLIVSPVAAARFILAKMRGCDGPQPKLGGVYMLGSCSRTFAGDAFVRNHFILGDFFVVEPESTVKFDVDMKLKEDYDFSCAHISKYGSVMRCNRMTLNVKHYDNGGGAVSTRDAKGTEERRNIEILMKKWPGCFRFNPKRDNEVIMRWKKGCNDDGDDDDEKDGTKHSAAAPRKGSKALLSSVRKTSMKKQLDFRGLRADARLVLTEKKAKSAYIAARCSKAAGRTVRQVVARASVRDDEGASHAYSLSDLRYDLKLGYLALKKSKK